MGLPCHAQMYAVRLESEGGESRMLEEGKVETFEKKRLKESLKLCYQKKREREERHM